MSEDFIGTRDVWFEFDRNFQPGGLYANDLPSERAAREADLIGRIGLRPTTPIDPVELLHARTERQFDALGAEVEPGFADLLDTQLDGITDEQIPGLTDAHIRELGMAALPDLVTTGSYGQPVLKPGAEQAIREAGEHWLKTGIEAALRVVPVEPSDRADFVRRISAHPHALKYLVSVDAQQQRRTAALARLPARRK